MSANINVIDLDDNIYFDISLINNTATPLQAIFNQTLNGPFLSNPRDYYLSAVRFFLDSASMPIFIFQNGLYYITISYQGSDYTQEVLYLPEYISNTFSYTNEVYSYQDFMLMINAAIKEACTTAGIYDEGAGYTDIPFLYFNTDDGKITLYAPSSITTTSAASWDSTNPANPSFYMNNALYYFFDNFSFYFFGDGLTSKKDYLLRIQDMSAGQNINNVILNGADAPNFYKMTQEYTAANRFRGAYTISFQSNTTGVRDEFNTGVNTSLTQNSVSHAGSGIPTTKQWTDFISEASADGNNISGWRGGLLYTPTSQYRLIDILNSVTMNQIDLTILWKDYQNNTYPFYVLPYTQASVKLVFVKRSLFNNNFSSSKKI